MLVARFQALFIPPVVCAVLIPGSAEAQLPSLEDQYTQPLASEAGGDLLEPVTVDEACLGAFLQKAGHSSGAMFLRDRQGSRDLVYRHLLGIWNTGENHIVTSGVRDFAHISGGGPDGLDAVASVGPTGLSIHAANSSRDGFENVLDLPSWLGLERVFAFGVGGPLVEIHGYDAQTRIMRRAQFDHAAMTLTETGSYIAPGGLLGMANLEYSSAHLGRELAFWSSVGWLIITSADAGTVIEMHDARPQADGTERGAVLATAGPDLAVLAWKSNDPQSGRERVELRNGNGAYAVYDLGGYEVRSMAAMDLNGDGHAGLVLALQNGESGHPQVLCWERVDGGVLLDASTNSATHGYDLILGSIYGSHDPSQLMVGDVDFDGDQDLFVFNASLGLLETLLSGSAPDMRSYALFRHHSLTTAGNSIQYEVEITLPPGYVAHPDTQLRLRCWPRGNPQGDWNFANSFDKFLSIPAERVAGDVLLESVTLDLTGTVDLNMNEYEVLMHSTLVDISAPQTVAASHATAVSVFHKGGLGVNSALERNALEETGSPLEEDSSVGGETTTTSNSGNTPIGSGPPPGGGS